MPVRGGGGEEENKGWCQAKGAKSQEKKEEEPARKPIDEQADTWELHIKGLWVQ